MDYFTASYGSTRFDKEYHREKLLLRQRIPKRSVQFIIVVMRVNMQSFAQID